MKNKMILFYALVSIFVVSAFVIFFDPTPADANSNLAKNTTTKPNIVFILADDLDASISEYWERVDELAGTRLSNCDQSLVTHGMSCDPLRKTRELIKNQGVTFKNAFVTTSLCCSSRASIETGEYAHNTGVIANGGEVGGYEAFVKYGNLDKTTAMHLQEAGYRTAIIGKYLNGIDGVTDVKQYPTDWSDLYIFNSGRNSYDGYDYTLFEKNKDQVCQDIAACTHAYDRKPADYSTDVLAEKAVNFIDEVAQTGEAFYLYVAPTAPHLPIPPAKRHQKHPYVQAVITKDTWPNYMEEDISDKSLSLQGTQSTREEGIKLFNDADYRERQGSMYALDDLVESIIKTLEKNNLLNDTYIIFAGDNGYNLGAHYLMHKMSPYEESIHIPLVMRGPGINAGQVNQNLVLGLDLAPTFIEIAGVNKNIPYDGLSLVPIFNKKQESNWRNDFINEYTAGGVAAHGIGGETPPAFWWLIGQDVPSYRSLRSEKFTYIDWYHAKDLVSWDPAKEQLIWNLNEKDLSISTELYDLEKDPFQLNNLLATEAGKKDCQQAINTLTTRLEALSSCKGKACSERYNYLDNWSSCTQHRKSP